ncbi:hypothetical protein IFM89_011954 [Coptis chinensis]|uniref:Uncharacterized protein n=1 Tax=Coptis chinensis TaxID=261450 RepID=A0A835H3U1_9MAGN|nr:hypothetical protein IFM89_011954 [Coptis chinensis]
MVFGHGLSTSAAKSQFLATAVGFPQLQVHFSPRKEIRRGKMYIFNEEGDSSDTEINIVEGSTNVSLEDEDESDDHSVSEIEGFEGQSNEADARSEQTNENDFDLFSGKLGGEDLDENAIMFSMRFKTSNEAFEFYNEAKYKLKTCEKMCFRSNDLSKEEEIHSTSGACGFVASEENSDKKKGRSRISKCGNCNEKQGITKTTCTWPKPQSQASSSKVPTTPPPYEGDQ